MHPHIRTSIHPHIRPSKNQTMQHFHANGKLLLTSEYFVLDGAIALALPCRFGQTLEITAHDLPLIHWRSFDKAGKMWFEGHFHWPDGKYLKGTDQAVGERLEAIFQAILKKGSAIAEAKGWMIETRLEFPRKWGLGTSSTLIANLARWADLDPYQLLENTFGGSGYDLACAIADGPLLYQRSQPNPIVTSVEFNPPFSDQLYFVYLGKKQNSREGIARYRGQGKQTTVEIDRMNQLTASFLKTNELETFEVLIQEHEVIIATKLKLKRAKVLHFPDFWGEIKSLGAWGGDFVLATSNRRETETLAYFNKKGFTDILKYKDLIL